MRYLLITMCFLVVFGCRKKSAPKTPKASVLVFPNKDSECTTGESLNETTSNVEFRWLASDDTETYELNVSNLTTGITQKISTASLSAKLPLEKGEPFSWVVISKNTKVNETASSETWQFYNAGSQTTYAPFPAQIIFPESGASVLRDINNEIELSWSGADIEDDIEVFEVYFGTEADANTLIASSPSGDTSHKVSVISETTYYWRIVTRDVEGNTSDTGIFQFKAL
ncbi:hypothetical protein GGR42_002261 [Saonia flava]|uniref:Fibronectin type-III domain-containing protein n=1 Tax=Saonia flava TaxID=523696 RepID=A0A846R4S2_9FLAO|nr:hypothetical protein [Saonia flava]NJB71799.1 hypothetical protein [Saonia flava]